MSVPRRIEWAVALLDPQPGERILEIGCGVGVAAAEICERLGGHGHLVALDRSAHAVARTMERNAAHVAAGRLTVVEAPLAALHVEVPFDKAVAVNVNVFWVADAAGECRALHAALAPGAPVHLVYDRGEHLDDVAATLFRHGFVRLERHADLPAVTARRP